MATGGAVRSVGLREGVLVACAVAVVAMVGLAVAEALDITLLVDPAAHMSGRGAAAAIGVGLLVADVVLPVPSSVVMLAHGALFGVVPGALLSLLGRTGNAVAGVVIGRGAGTVLGGPQAPTARGRGAQLVDRWGLAAVVLTRPLPVLAESTLVAAAAMRLSPVAVVVAAVVGAVPEAVLYAVAGNVADTYVSAAVVFVAVIVLAAGVWAIGARVEGRSSDRTETAAMEPRR